MNTHDSPRAQRAADLEQLRTSAPRPSGSVLLGALRSRIGGALIACALATLTACASAPPRPTPPIPTPPATFTALVRVYLGDPAKDDKAAGAPVRMTVTRDGGTVSAEAIADGAGNASFEGISAGAVTACAQAPGWKPGCADGSVPGAAIDVALARDVPPIQALRADGKIFRTADGQPWRWKGVSAFRLLDRYARGEDISDFLEAYRGFNVLRVWPYVEWGASGWNTPPADTIIAFVRAMGARGWYVELTLLTDDAPARLAWAQGLIPQLAAAHLDNLLLEAGNEPETHKAINTAALIPALEASGYPWATGNYEDSQKMRGRYGVTHTARDAEWPRRAHDLLEFFGGGGPNDPSDPAHRFPIVADEPAKLQDVSGNRPLDWRAYFATVSLLGGGGTFHCETCKYAQLPTADERVLAAEALAGLNAFPADAPLGPYTRPDDASLRTYIVGPFMVRIRPTSAPPPSGAWVSLDSDGILWKR